MVAYTVINSTAAELTNVNVGGTDVPAYTVMSNVTLTDAELAAVTALNGVAVMQDGASAAEQLAVGNQLIAGSANLAVQSYYEVANGSSSSVIYNASNDTVAARDLVAVRMLPSDLYNVTVDGVVLRVKQVAGSVSATTADNMRAARMLARGVDSSL